MLQSPVELSGAEKWIEIINEFITMSGKTVIWPTVNIKILITNALQCVFEQVLKIIHQVLSELMNRKSKYRIPLWIGACVCTWRNICPQGWKIASKENAHFLCYDRNEK